VLLWQPDLVTRGDNAVAWEGGDWRETNVSRLVDRFRNVRSSQGARRFVETYGPFVIPRSILVSADAVPAGCWNYSEQADARAIADEFAWNASPDSLVRGWMTTGLCIRAEAGGTRLVVYASASAILAFQLTALLDHQPSMMCCSACHRWYRRRVRYQPGRANYCARCNGAPAARIRQQRRRDRLRGSA
jgi:hypothetical protein